MTVIDRTGVAAGSSAGNSGLIVPSHSIPLASPGVITKGLRWLLDPSSPFYVKPRPSRELASWLCRFLTAARHGPMERSAGILASLTLASSREYKELIPREQIECHYLQRGILGLYTTQEGLSEGAAEAELMRRHGIRSTNLEPHEILEIEPSIAPEVKGGVLYETDSNLEPTELMRGLASRVVAMGGVIESGREVTSISTRGGRITSVTAVGAQYRPNEVVLAAGSWSPEIGRYLGLRLPVQPAKGYSITVTTDDWGWRPEVPIMAHEARSALAPMGTCIRMAGTLELGGMNTRIDRRRIRAIVAGIGRFLTVPSGMHIDHEQVWCGLRPCTPDGLPMIGRTSQHENLIVATGHAMIGMTLGPITGRLVSQLAIGDQPEMDVAPLAPDRFS